MTDPCFQRMAFIASQNLDRVAMLCDQLLKLNVPREALQPIIDWLNESAPNGRPKIELKP